MFVFIIGVALAIGCISMGLKQGQANPEAGNFFASNASAPSK